MAMVRPSIKMEEPGRTTTKILNLYNKSADPANRTGSVVLTTTADVGSEIDMGDFDASEITVIFEDEIETLYVGPVEISEEEENQRRLLEEAAAEAAESVARLGRSIASNGSRKNNNNNNSNVTTLLNTGASLSSTSGITVYAAGSAKTHHQQQVKSQSAFSAVKLSSPVASNGSDSGIDNCSVRDDNKRKNTSPLAQRKDQTLQPKKKTHVQTKLTDMVIKKRGRPPGGSAEGQSPPKEAKMGTAVKRPSAEQTKQAVTPARAPVAVAKASVSPKAQYECELCEEVFSREDVIVDHYQSYHRVDPKKRSIKPRVNIPREPEPVHEEEEVVEQEDVPEEEEEEDEEEDEEEQLEMPVLEVVDDTFEFEDGDEDLVEELSVEDAVLASPPAPVVVTVPAVGAAKRGRAKKAPKEKKVAPGLICGKCNLTFRTILLLSRHVKLMHDTKMQEDEEEEEEEEEEEMVVEEQSPRSLLKPRGKENVKVEGSGAAASSSSSAVSPSAPVAVAARKPRGRPKKVAEVVDAVEPRILNADKGIVRVRLANYEEDEDYVSPDPHFNTASTVAETTTITTADVKPPPSRRGRKRKSMTFAEDDNENEVVPKAPSVKRGVSTAMPAAAATRRQVATKKSVNDPAGTIYVEVIPNKDSHHYLNEEVVKGEEDQDEQEEEEDQDEDSEADEEVSHARALVYKIKDINPVDKEGNQKYPCPLCDLTFTRRYSLEPHIQRVHQKLRTKECQYCDRKFLATGDLTRHMAIHTGAKPYECSIQGCPYRFVSRSDLAKHELRHTAGVPRTYVCGQCDKSFERPYDLRRHQMTHKDLVGQVDFRSYKCDQCDKVFSRKDEYRAHMYRHLGVKPIKCHVCGKAFVDQSNCAKHCKGHGPLTHDGADDPLECGDCGQRFTNQAALGRHLTKCLHERSELPVHSVPQWDYFEDDVK